MSTFEIVTIFNDPAQYAAAAASFVAAGFTPGRARFTPLDNSCENRHDPYAVLGGIAASAGPEPYVILCHQDVRLDLGDGCDRLASLVARVEAADPDWAVLGNAGVNYRRQPRWWLDDPRGQHRTAPVPEAVISLDENFLVLHRGQVAAPTPGLAGFHLYATDLVLNAALTGRRSYVVPFLITHLSAGNLTSPEFDRAAVRFDAAWQARVAVGVVNTTCTYFVLSRWRSVRWLLRQWRVRAALAWCGLTLAPHWWGCLGVGRGSSLRLAGRLP